MHLLGYLVFACSILGVVYATALCTYETMKCNPLWPRIRPEYFMEVTSELGRVCKFQKDFFNCIRNVSNNICDGEYHPVLLRSEALFAQLCDRNSAFFKAYNRSVHYINSIGYFDCYQSEKDPYHMTRDEYCKYREHGFECVSKKLKLYFKERLPEPLNVYRTVETMQIDEPYYCYTLAELALASELESRAGQMYSSDGIHAQTHGIKQTGHIPFQRHPSAYKSGLVYNFDYSRPDIHSKPELNKLRYDNANAYQGSSYIYSEPSVTSPKKREMSGDLKASQTSFVDYLEIAAETDDPLAELENIVGDYVEKLAEQMD